MIPWSCFCLFDYRDVHIVHTTLITACRDNREQMRIDVSQENQMRLNVKCRSDSISMLNWTIDVACLLSCIRDIEKRVHYMGKTTLTSNWIRVFVDIQLWRHMKCILCVTRVFIAKQMQFPREKGDKYFRRNTFAATNSLCSEASMKWHLRICHGKERNSKIWRWLLAATWTMHRFLLVYDHLHGYLFTLTWMWYRRVVYGIPVADNDDICNSAKTKAKGKRSKWIMQWLLLAMQFEVILNLFGGEAGVNWQTNRPLNIHCILFVWPHEMKHLSTEMCGRDCASQPN